MSKTQVPITFDEVRRIIRHHFGGDVPMGTITELKGGFYSIAYAVEMPGLGFDVIVKLDPPKKQNRLTYEHDCLEIEVKAIEHLASNPVGKTLPIPELLAHDVEGSLMGRGYFITKKFKGKTWYQLKGSLSREETREIEQMIGGIQARMHSIKGVDFGYFVTNPAHPVTSKSWSGAFTSMMECLYDDASRYGVRLPVSQDRMSEALEHARNALDEIQEPSFVHWDLWEGNVFLVKISGQWTVEGIIDFERSLWGDPLMEILFRGKKKRMNVMAGYGRDLFISPGARTRDALYEMYLAFIFLIESKARKYPFYIKTFFYLLARAKIHHAWSILNEHVRK
nr:aminoglycoside phosphotransferase family protein [Candidatus Sigynarchaeota archaeon]